MLNIVSVFSASYLCVLCTMKHISENIKSRKRELTHNLLTSLYFKASAEGGNMNFG